MNQLRVVILIQVLSSSVGGVLSVVLPLMMVERNIDIVTIALIFASMPMIFQLGRMFFATVSDFWGRKPFFVFNGFAGVISSLIYYLAYTPLEYLFGKIMEGTKDGSLWAVNRAFLLENSKDKWRVLVHLRTTAYISVAVGSLAAGFFVTWFLYEGTLMLCVLIGLSAIPFSLLITSQRKKKLNASEALHFLDFRKKKRIFKIFVILFFVMGLSFGFVTGFVFPLFLSSEGFNTEVIGVILGLQILLAGLFSYFFARRLEMRKLLILSGTLYTIVLVLLGFSNALLAGFLVIVYGMIDGLLSIGQEGILSRITNQESYGIDIGLLMMGLHTGRTVSQALSGILIASFGFASSFLISGLIFPIFYATSYFVLKE